MLLFVHAYSTYITKLLSSFSGFRSKSTMYWALASRLHSRHVRCTTLKFASEQHKREAKKQADLKSTIQRNELLREARLV